MIHPFTAQRTEIHSFFLLSKKISLAFLGSLLLTISAKTIIPIWPVNGTLQTLVLPLLGVFLGPRLGAATVGLYLLEGAIGLPVFTGTPEKGLGLTYMMGPSAGFLVGFIPATYTMGLLYEKGWCNSVPSTLKAVVLSSLLVIMPGILWLCYLFGVQSSIANFLGFLPGSITKTCLATMLIYRFKNY